jgi:hypothetical protein
MIRWLLLAAFTFLVIATLQSFVANRREKKQVEGKDFLASLPPLPDVTEIEKSRRDLEDLERRLDIQDTGQKGKGA